jgi:hypothetical protein
LLRDLRETIFTFPDYNPPKTKRGEHELKFMTRAGKPFSATFAVLLIRTNPGVDAEAFMATMVELAHELV